MQQCHAPVPYSTRAPNLRSRVATSWSGASVLLKLRRGNIAESGVKSPLVINVADEFVNAGTGLVEIPILVAIDLLILQRLHERFAGRIVVRIAFSAHADFRAVFFQHVRIFLRGILNASIGVMHPTWRRLSLHQRHTQSRHRQFCHQPSSQGPTDHTTRVCVENDRQVNKLDPQADIGDIGNPKLIDAAGVNWAARFG